MNDYNEINCNEVNFLNEIFCRLIAKQRIYEPDNKLEEKNLTKAELINRTTAYVAHLEPNTLELMIEELFNQCTKFAYLPENYKRERFHKHLLILASRSGYTNILKILLEKNTATGLKQNELLLQIACRTALSNGQLETAGVLLAQGTDLMEDYGYLHKQTALLDAIDGGCQLEWLEKFHLWPPTQEKYDEALLTAAIKSHLPATKWLVNNGASHESIHHAFFTILDMTKEATEENRELILLLAERINIKQKTSNGKTALILAIEANDPEIVRLFLAKHNDLDDHQREIYEAFRKLLWQIHKKDLAGLEKELSLKKAHDILSALLHAGVKLSLMAKDDCLEASKITPEETIGFFDEKALRLETINFFYTIPIDQDLLIPSDLIDLLHTSQEFLTPFIAQVAEYQAHAKTVVENTIQDSPLRLPPPLAHLIRQHLFYMPEETKSLNNGGTQETNEAQQNDIAAEFQPATFAQDPDSSSGGGVSNSDSLWGYGSLSNG